MKRQCAKIVPFHHRERQGVNIKEQRTALRSHIYDGSLAEFEERYPTRFVRVHRNALVARGAIRALEKYDDGEDAEGWALRLAGIEEPVVVSRRQLSTVREALKEST